MINLHYYFNLIWFKFIHFEIWFISASGFYTFVHILRRYFGKITSDALYLISGWDTRTLIIGALLDRLRLPPLDVATWWLAGPDGGSTSMLCSRCKEAIVENRGRKSAVYGKLSIWCKSVLLLGYTIQYNTHICCIGLHLGRRNILEIVTNYKIRETVDFHYIKFQIPHLASVAAVLHAPVNVKSSVERTSIVARWIFIGG